MQGLEPIPKNIAIAMVPDSPGRQQHQGVERFATQFRHHLPRRHPPRIDPVATRWAALLPSSTSERLKPDFPGIDALKQEVVDGFHILRIDRASARVLQPMPKSAFRGPAPVQDGEPHE
jgi:hypothetical protein